MPSTNWTPATTTSTGYTPASVSSTGFTPWEDIDNTVTLGDTTYTLGSTVVLMTGELNTSTTYKNTANWSQT